MTKIEPGNYYVLIRYLAAKYSPWVLEWPDYHDDCIVFVQDVFETNNMLMATVYLSNTSVGNVSAACLVPFQSDRSMEAR